MQEMFKNFCVFFFWNHAKVMYDSSEIPAFQIDPKQSGLTRTSTEMWFEKFREYGQGITTRLQ